MTLEIFPVPGFGTEDVVVVPTGQTKGAAFTGTEDGSIWRVSHDGRRIDLVADTGGRPLGIEIGPDRRLVVCDTRGLLRVDPVRGAVDVLVAKVDGRPMRFCNNAAVAEDGTIWFTDSSRHFGIDSWRDEMARNTHTGRLLRRDPDGAVEVVADGLRFANGVALAADASYVVVAETAACRLTRWWLSGDRAGEKDLFVASLPGYPDNIARGSDGLVWTTIASPVDPLVERIQHGPEWVRAAVTKVPTSLQPGEKRTVRVQAYDGSGRFVHDLDLPADGFHMATGVREYDGRVWLSSLREPAMAVTDL